MENEVIEDAIQLCDRAIRTKGDNADFERGFREISIDNVKLHEFQTIRDDGNVLYYKNIKTPYLLQKNKIIDMDVWFSDIRNASKKRAAGYFEVAFDYEKAREWMNRAIKKLLNKPNHIIVPEGKDHVYENGVFTIVLQNRMIDVIDLSNSPEVKPVFDTIYSLYKNSPKSYFSKQELIKEYEKISYHEIGWVSFTEKISDIKKRINKKNAFKQRVILKFDKKTQSYEFRILPLPLSDN